MKSPFEMTPIEYQSYLVEEGIKEAAERKLKGICEECRGEKSVQVWGMFSQFEKCEKCNGTGKVIP